MQQDCLGCRLSPATQSRPQSSQVFICLWEFLRLFFLFYLEPPPRPPRHWVLVWVSGMLHVQLQVAGCWLQVAGCWLLQHWWSDLVVRAFLFAAISVWAVAPRSGGGGRRLASWCVWGRGRYGGGWVKVGTRHDLSRKREREREEEELLGLWILFQNFI